MHADNEWIFPGRIVMGRVQQPTLDREGITSPVDGFGFTPRRLEAVIVVRNRMRRLAQRAEINLWGSGERALDIRHPVLGHRETKLQASVADGGGNG
jgi:hypothetical protein